MTENKQMRLIKTGLLAVMMCMAFAFTFGMSKITAKASSTSGVVTTTSGTFGKNKGLSWTMNEKKKLITITGEDEADVEQVRKEGDTSNTLYNSVFNRRVEKIEFKDCTITGSMSNFFARLTYLKEIDFGGLTMVDISHMDSMFYGCDRLVKMDVSDFNMSEVITTSAMFYGCSGLTSLNLSKWDTKNLTDMSYMFRNCTGLTELDLSKWDTSSAEDMGKLFYGCTGLTSVNIKGWDTGRVKTMQDMFYGCSGLTELDFSGFDTKNLTYTSRMFYDCTALESVGLEKLNTQSLTDMQQMFYNCKALTEVDLSSFTTDKVINMQDMFSGCESLKTVDLSNFKTEKLTNIQGMFNGCKALTSVDISGFNTGKVTSTQDMFKDCAALETVKTPEVMGTKNIALPDTFKNTAGTATKAVTKDFVKMTLTKASGEEAPDPDKDTSDKDKDTDKDADKDKDKDKDTSDKDKDTSDKDKDISNATGWVAGYWYENGVKQGTEGRGKEIYDPVSKAWYWLDAEQGGAVAKDKDVYLESNGGKWVRYGEDSRMIKGEDFRNGGWYYFDQVSGMMMKGFLQLLDGRKVYYDPVTGQMVKGVVEIEGVKYEFNEDTGDLVSTDAGDNAGNCVWLTIDGRKFWFEGWNRQGWNPADPDYRGKEIYDPASDAWYWLDNVTQGSMAVSKDVYQDSEAGEWGAVDNGDGTRSGKWVRYDKDGHMIKGWCAGQGEDAVVIESPDQADGKDVYYFDLTYGTMAKGKVTIDGATYTFDGVTGILQK